MFTFVSYNASAPLGFDYLSSNDIAVAQTIQTPAVPGENRGRRYTTKGYIVPRRINLYVAGWQKETLFFPSIWSYTTGITIWKPGDGTVLSPARYASEINTALSQQIDPFPLLAIEENKNYDFGGYHRPTNSAGLSVLTLPETSASPSQNSFTWDSSFPSTGYFEANITRTGKTLYMWIEYDYIPSAPRNLMATGLSGNRVYLNWDAPVNIGSSDGLGYSVYYRKQGNTTWVKHYDSFTSTNTTITLPDDPSPTGDEYEFTVAAFNSASTAVPYLQTDPLGESEYSNIDTAIMQGQGPQVFKSNYTWVTTDMYVYGSKDGTPDWIPASINVYDGTTWKEV